MMQITSDTFFEMADKMEETARQLRSGGGNDPVMTRSQTYDLMADIFRDLWLDIISK